jgi:hypothetical protein
MTPSFQPAELLTLSHRVLTLRDERMTGVWPRASALLARQALERAVSEVLAVRAPGSERVSLRARLLCLREYVPDALAHRTEFLWATLSRVCHHHPYELAPTAAEISGWLDDAELLVGDLRALGR